LRSAGRGTLCASVLDRLTVSRVNSLPGNRPHFSFPATVQVDAAAQAQAVARALCSIPPLRSGDLACPADFGIVYRLDFASAGERLPEVTIRAGGCQTVAGAGLSGSAISSPAFWTVLGTAMGLKGPGHPAFAGTMPS
jgi:hypothetical protein